MLQFRKHEGVLEMSIALTRNPQLARQCISSAKNWIGKRAGYASTAVRRSLAPKNSSLERHTLILPTYALLPSDKNLDVSMVNSPLWNAQLIMKSPYK